MSIERQLGSQPGDNLEHFSFADTKETEAMPNLLTNKIGHIARSETNDTYVVNVGAEKAYFVRSFTDATGKELSSDQIAAMNNKAPEQQSRVFLELAQQGETPEENIYIGRIES
jgi:hypothetical protein